MNDPMPMVPMVHIPNPMNMDIVGSQAFQLEAMKSAAFFSGACCDSAKVVMLLSIDSVLMYEHCVRHLVTTEYAAPVRAVLHRGKVVRVYDS